MIDASHIKVHAYGMGAVGENEAMGHTKGDKLHLAVDAHGIPVKARLTTGPVADCQIAQKLIDGLNADALLADRCYDSDTVIARAEARVMEVLIPPRQNRREQREFDQARYKNRHVIENVFAHLKQWRGIATRYAKRSSSLSGKYSDTLYCYLG